MVPQGQTITLRGRAQDAEDGAVPCDALQWELFQGHNAHAHPLGVRAGCETSLLVAPAAGHGDAANLFFVAELVYTDGGGAAGEPPITARRSVRIVVGPPAPGSPSGAFVEAAG